jgi:co-chaperonin GroES (HSP10)|tara:strand:- start:221 stop:616 length:396 start_codon:yes stop_codon:yes gene_type:complete
MKKVVAESKKEELTPEEVESNKKQLPDPSGYRILVAMPVADEKTEGGILKANQTIKDEEVSNICGMVIKLGPDCYQDERRFPSGPWCKEKDWVVFRAYSGTRMKMYGQEFRLINDDTVEAVVEDPTGVVRA